MRKDFKFYIGQPVTITAINSPATIIGYKLDGRNVYASVAYWLDGKMQEVYLDESELKPAKEKT